jgi:CHASE3 domain sensor protein
MTIGKQLAFAFGAVIALVSISAIVGYYAVAAMKQSATKTSEESFPALTACQALETGLSRSLASLRGYIILGTDPEEAKLFKSQRQVAWQEIEAAVNELSRLSHLWTEANDKNSLRMIISEIPQLSAAQQAVEDIAHAADNIAAYHLLDTEAAPEAEEMDSALAAIISEEGTLEATLRRKEFLKVMSDMRGTLAVSLTTMRVYIVSGDTELRQRFDQQWQRYQQAHELAVSMLGRMTQTQRATWDRFETLHAELVPLPNRMLQLRETDDWNKADHHLRTTAVPLAEGISRAVEILRRSANRRMKNDRAQAVATGTKLTATLIIISLLAVIIGGAES